MGEDCSLIRPQGEEGTNERIFAMHRLKLGASLEDCRKWSVSLDQKVTLFLPACHHFEMHAIEGAKKGESPYQIVEWDIDVESWEAWQEALARDAMKVVVAARGNCGGDSRMKMIFRKKLK
jgi:hypothetical protein